MLAVSSPCASEYPIIWTDGASGYSINVLKFLDGLTEFLTLRFIGG